MDFETAMVHAASGFIVSRTDVRVTGDGEGFVLWPDKDEYVPSEEDETATDWRVE